jgi:hypothetical protein
METRLFNLYDASQVMRSHFNFDMLIYNSNLPLPQAVLNVVPDNGRK